MSELERAPKIQPMVKGTTEEFLAHLNRKPKMRLRWDHFDNWLVKAFAFLIVIGGLFWMVYSVRYHYHTKAADWEYLPFVVSGLAIMFALAILSKSATQAAASVILPFVEQLRLGRRATDSFAVVTPPVKPPATVIVPVSPVSDSDQDKP